jgi:hypothetical protein
MRSPGTEQQKPGIYVSAGRYTEGGAARAQGCNLGMLLHERQGVSTSEDDERVRGMAKAAGSLFICPSCGEEGCIAVCTRHHHGMVKRNRACKRCGYRFITTETWEFPKENENETTVIHR